LKEDEIPDIDKSTSIAVLNQTTLNYSYVLSLFEKIKKIYKNVDTVPNSDICKATFDRQTALKDNLDFIQALVVL
jgi:4-hydroxy-3-methylbut-2-enyl diphosphate reductase IspH